MRHYAVLGLTMIAVGVVPACSDDEGNGTTPTAGAAGRAGAGGAAGSGGAAGTGGAAGGGGAAGRAGGGGAGGNPLPPPVPALAADAATVTCPTVINGSLDTSDRTQTGRHSRFGDASVCGTAKGAPGNAADPSNPHLFDVYRFANPTAAPVCFNFTLTYGGIGVVSDAGLDAGADAGGLEAEPDAADAGSDAGVVVPLPPAKYMNAYGTFFPTDISLQYLGDVGAVLTSPQAMGVTVPANGTIDVVVYAVDNAPLGVDSYTLSCSTQ